MQRPFLRFSPFTNLSSYPFCPLSHFSTTFHFSSNLEQKCSGLIISLGLHFSMRTLMSHKTYQINLLLFSQFNFQAPPRTLRKSRVSISFPTKQEIKLYLRTLSSSPCHYFSITFNPLLQQWSCLQVGTSEVMTDLFLPPHSSSH